MKILLADDEVDFTKAIAAILSHANYKVDIVYNGEDALYYGLEGYYDLLILDVMMPKLDGFQVLDNLRNEGITTPILMLTAKSDPHDKVKGLRHGADDYLGKPFEMEELLARIEALLRRSTTFMKSSINNEVSFHRFEAEIEYKGRRVSFTNKEFQIFELLYMNPKQVFSLNHIIDRVWDLDTTVDDSVVWTNISSIRRKLDEAKLPFAIRNRRGIGYCLERLNNV